MRTSSILLLAALAITASTKPLPAPTPPPVDDGAEDGAQSPGKPSCTTVLTSSIRGFRGDWTPFIEETIYTATQTVYHRVPCNGCVLSITTELVKPWGGVGPVEQVTATVTAAEPFKTTSTICSVSTTPVHPAIPRYAAAKRANKDPAEKKKDPNCTATRPVPLKPTFGPVETIWTTTATSTSHVDCGGCRHVATSTVNFMNHGPVVHFTTRETAATPTTSTTYVCLKTPSVVGVDPTPEPSP